MLTGGDDFPIHQAPEPVALVIDRNFYDRYFFNGYTPDGSLFFAAAMGFYPSLDVVDGAFCVAVDGVQYNLRASARLNGERMVLRVGPIAIEILEPLNRLRLTVAANDGPLSADLTFTGRHFPIEEPRFTRRVGTRLYMDYTRLTQNGGWSGWIDVAGQRRTIDATVKGTRDRSWGIRPVGKGDAQPAPLPPQFYWLWTPSGFDDLSLYMHTNDDGDGAPWNRRAVLARDGGGRGAEADFHDVAIRYDWSGGGRRLRQVTAQLGPDTRVTLTPTATPHGTRGHFYMNGLGYTHPLWGHGMDHGDLEVAHDQIDLAAVDDNDPFYMHIQAIADAVLEHEGQTRRGRGVVEQLFIGAHAPTGLTGLFDPHPGSAA
jgi:hypothetical protein